MQLAMSGELPETAKTETGIAERAKAIKGGTAVKKKMQMMVVLMDDRADQPTSHSQPLSQPASHPTHPASASGLRS